MLTIIRILLAALFLSVSNIHAEDIINDNWSDMSSWEAMSFPSIEQHTRYSIEHDDKDKPMIKAVSKASASGVVHKTIIDVYKTPSIAWEWKVQNILKKGDATKKSGDDYPARVYLLFEYDSEKASFFKRLRYDSIKLLHGMYPPDTSISYIWSNKTHSKIYMPNAYSEDAMMIVLQSGSSKVNQWQREERNILQDYEKVFGSTPPKRARLALMVDADNTQGSATSYFRSIELSE